MNQNPPADANRNKQRNHPEHDVDQDMKKGAIEGPPDGQDNSNAPGLDDQGWPNDEVAIAQDRIGANEDKTQG